MRVARDYQKKSAVRWMGCSETLDVEPDRRQYLKNSKRDEEVEDVVNDDEEDMYFEFEQNSKASNISSFKLVTILLVIFSFARQVSRNNFV